MHTPSPWFIIVNPASAGGRTRHRWERIEHKLQQRGIQYIAALTDHEGHALELVQTAVSQGYTLIVVVGGDGSINEVVHGICTQTILPVANVTLGVIPAGTGCDWIKTHHIPKNIDKAIDIILAQRTIKHDVGRVSYVQNGQTKVRHFFNVAGMAFDAYVAKKSLKVDKSGFFGQFVYLWLVLTSIWKYKSGKMQLSGSDIAYESTVFCLNIGICKYSGGGMRTVPLSIPDDGLFDVTIIENRPIWKILKELPRLYTGTIYQAPQVPHFRVKEVTITGENIIDALEVDGEMLGDLPLQFQILPHLLNVCV